MLTDTIPQDLVWDLKGLTKPEQAVNFFRCFENSFCVYSRSVEKIYTDYNNFVTGAPRRKKLVILPNFERYDTFFNEINRDSVTPTQIYVFAERTGRQIRIFLTGRSRTDRKLLKLPFLKGLKAMRQGVFAEGCFLPILAQGDLRELPEQTTPYMRLHQVHVDRLTHRSQFDRSQINEACWLGLTNTFQL